MEVNLKRLSTDILVQVAYMPCTNVTVKMVTMNL